MNDKPRMTNAEAIEKIDEYYASFAGDVTKSPTEEKAMEYAGYHGKTLYKKGKSYILAHVKQKQEQWARERGFSLEGAGKRSDFTQFYLNRYFPAVPQTQKLELSGSVQSRVTLSSEIVSRIDGLADSPDEDKT